MAGPEIGGRRIAPHRVAIVDLSLADTRLGQPVDLIAGYLLLSQADWTFDYPARRWAIARSADVDAINAPGTASSP